MANLVDGDRFAVFAQYMRDNQEPINLTKADLRAAVDAVDAWVEANKSAYNTAIPQPARAELSATQKTFLLLAVVMKRREKGE